VVTHVVKVTSQARGKGVLVTDSAQEAGEYVTTLLSGPTEMEVSVCKAGPPTRYPAGVSGLACDWCRRPGQVVFHTMRHHGKDGPNNPILCSVCTGLLGYGASSLTNQRERLAQAQQDVLEELTTRWRHRVDDQL